MSVEEFAESNQRFAVNLAMGLILWVFSLFLFHPLIVRYALEWSGLISALLVVAISYYLVRAMMNSRPIIDYASNKLTTWWMNWRELNVDDRQTHYMRSKKVLKTGLLLLVYLLYHPLLSGINPALAGLAFVLVLVYMLKIVFEQK